ncbi:MAG: conjugal transfer protein TrbF [Sphingobium sp.]
MLFKRSVQRYGHTPSPETPYQRAAQVWDDRIGSARVQARNWRLAAFVSLGLTGGLSAALVWQSMQSRVVPYVVEVDRLGEARSVSEVAANYRPTDPQVAWHLARFITNVRSASLDPVLMRRGWLEAYDFATRRGAQFLGEYARTNDPFARVGERTVSVQVTSVVRASDSSFQVKWTETAYERGVKAGTSRWTAILTTVTKTPVNADTLRKNPLGIYVDAIDWSRELDGEPPASPTSMPPSESRAGPAVQPTISADVPMGSPLDPGLAQTTPQTIQETKP